jgi:soluble cytochrome b562
MATKKSILQKAFIERKEFSYRKDSAQLNFTLRTDNSSELRDFRECLAEAIKDIDEIIKEMKN